MTTVAPPDRLMFIANGASCDRPVHFEVERIPAFVFEHAGDASRTVAREIAECIQLKQAEGSACVLGLATGSTPTQVYAELVRLHREEGLSLANVMTFNLDEYWPADPTSLQSYHRFMKEHLFDHVDIDPGNIHVPDGTIPADRIRSYCDEYEQAIHDAGGIDIQVLGIGRTGHIGFNEPGSSRTSRTRLIHLDKVTRTDAASDFFGEDNVPTRAITMGVGTILDARRIMLLAFGEGKAAVVRDAIEGEVTESIAASFLQEHPRAGMYLDKPAAAAMVRCSRPWEVGPVTWTERRVRQAVVSLADATEKSILKLTPEDYNEHGLQGLLAERGSANELNVQVFRALQRVITGWPGGKPADRKQVGDIDRPTDEVYPKRVLVFSPHPDDDVISMGGTLQRLVDQGHEVHVAYQTSGNIAVFDSEALRFADFVTHFNEMFGFSDHDAQAMESRIAEAIRAKHPGDVDSPEVQAIKGLIRRVEATDAGRYCGIPEARLHFLDMPFYETGRVTKKALSTEDFEIIVSLLREIRPHQVYAAGDLSDPHGTHRTCLAAVHAGLIRTANDDWADSCEVLLYRGAWQEWSIEEMDMAVPLSPEELKRKIRAIFKHQSQKDKALFPGADDREFWQRAEQRNRGTAEHLNKLGLAEYEAIEAFVRWDGQPLDDTR
ncbi:MAG: glucosamine-6-phosphate deaminase [Phycisphaerales bacterium]|nr:glucosamine-6-phosphate deaminase [Phycisphaerales bacterium]